MYSTALEMHCSEEMYSSSVPKCALHHTGKAPQFAMGMQIWESLLWSSVDKNCCAHAWLWPIYLGEPGIYTWECFGSMCLYRVSRRRGVCCGTSKVTHPCRSADSGLETIINGCLALACTQKYIEWWRWEGHTCTSIFIKNHITWYIFGCIKAGHLW